MRNRYRVPGLICLNIEKIADALSCLSILS